ncbi:MAG: hypothetical protein P8X54_03815 [Desulfuromonadales bacterium]
MEFMIANDFLLECIRAAVLIALLVILFLRGNYTSLSRHPGWKSPATSSVTYWSWSGFTG